MRDKILIVDDVEINRELLAEILRWTYWKRVTWK